MVVQFDLATKSAAVLKAVGEFEHRFFDVGSLAGSRAPGGIDIDMACGARAGSAAIAIPGTWFFTATSMTDWPGKATMTRSAPPAWKKVIIYHVRPVTFPALIG